MQRPTFLWLLIPGFDTPTPVKVEHLPDGSYCCRYRAADPAREPLSAELAAVGHSETAAAAKAAYITHCVSILRST